MGEVSAAIRDTLVLEAIIFEPIACNMGDVSAAIKDTLVFKAIIFGFIGELSAVMRDIPTSEAI